MRRKNSRRKTLICAFLTQYSTLNFLVRRSLSEIIIGQQENCNDSETQSQQTGYANGFWDLPATFVAGVCDTEPSRTACLAEAS